MEVKFITIICLMGLLLSCNRKDENRYVQVQEEVYESAESYTGIDLGRVLFISQDDGYVYLLTEGELTQLYEFGYLPENAGKKNV